MEDKELKKTRRKGTCRKRREVYTYSSLRIVKEYHSIRHRLPKIPRNEKGEEASNHLTHKKYNSSIKKDEESRERKRESVKIEQGVKGTSVVRGRKEKTSIGEDEGKWI